MKAYNRGDEMTGRLMKGDQDAYECMKYLLFSYNLVFFVCACAVLGTGIWMAIDRSFMATITGEDVYPAAIYLMLIGGAAMFVVSFCACIGAVSENKCLLWGFFITMVVILVCYVLAAILAIAFSAQIGDKIKDTMRKTLREEYGVELYNDHHRLVTRAWDKAQEKLGCCGVENRGWRVYRETEWYKLHGPEEQDLHTPEVDKTYVPRSCCVRDRFGRYANLRLCQTWELGPPRLEQGAINRGLYYEGCFEAGKRSMTENSGLIIGFTIGFALVLVAGLLLSWLMLKRMNEAEQL